MTYRALPKLLLLAGLAVASSAHADYASDLGDITAPASVLFNNSTSTLLSVSALPQQAPYNFVDRWSFTLVGQANVTSLVAAFNFGSGPGTTFGISNLQVNLLNALGAVATGWLSVNTSGPFTQLVSVTPSTGLTEGDYTLQVRGQLLAPPASYAGTLIAAGAPPIVTPLPAVLPLLLAGLGFFGVMASRGKKRD
jgi:hypothetical protein